MNKLLATCDRILARLPVALTSENVIGGIIVPKASMEAMERHAIIQLEIVAAGPDCKVARAGDLVVVNKNVCSPIEWDGNEYMVFSEVTAFAIVRRDEDDVVADVASQNYKAPAGPLKIEEIRAGLGIPTKPVDDASDLPVEPAANAQPAQASS